MSMTSAPLSHHEPHAEATTQQALLLCGIAGSCFYVLGDAIGSSPPGVTFRLISALFTIAFSVGILDVAAGNRALRITGFCLLVMGLLGLAEPFAPVHAVQAMLILAAISAASFVRDDWFRLLSIIAISAIVMFSVISALGGFSSASRIAAYTYLSWAAVLSALLLRDERRRR